jgi:hypothetical protein
MSLNGLMDLSFPTMNTLDKNLDKLVKIFGVYVVYALIEVVRLIMNNKNSQEKHWHSSYFGDASNFEGRKFREGKFVNSLDKRRFRSMAYVEYFSNGDIKFR